ncbi:ferrochelatase [Paenibacillus sp. JCM 10914]|uniref:ferrochelatase n=1 Tax=Paenibacillus sp. JCM 10914 TaxID=1236974 RepID=UPI0003CC8547|nr:ferrochelatase [Paenibacillus sp. JCM 10914]GAE05176.1 ferrochelatase, protoheme ferro-lyase [Paenibacillus sp. JCM 10914]
MKAVLLLTYASLKSIDEVPAFYTHLFHGQTPPPGKMEEALLRFRSMGTADPLGSVTSRMAIALQRRLRQYTGEDVQIYQASKHTSPFIEETVEQIASAGFTQLFTFPTSPLYSRSGTKAYHHRVRKTLAAIGADIPVVEINHWHLFPGVVQSISLRLQAALQWLSAETRQQATVLFTAHSQPGSPASNAEFIASFRDMAAAVAADAGWNRYQLAYRSAGPSTQKWLEPDVLDVIEDVSNKSGKAVVLCDLLSLTENVEAVYDCRVHSSQKAADCGLEFVATEFLNDAADYVEALSELIYGYMDSPDK